jgi:hypothetical protein
MDDASRFDVLAALASNPALPSQEHGPAQGLGDTLSPREAQLFDAAWHLVAAVNGGGPLPHKTVAERAQEATAVLLPLLDARNAPANPATSEPSSTDTESAPKPGELRLFDGQLCRFIERELEGDKWEVIGLFPAPGSNTPAGEGEKLREAWRPASEQPEPGRKIIAPYNDGSGAQLFYVHEAGVIDQDGDEFGFERLEEQFDMWAYLPAGMKLWCEVRGGDDAFTFPEPASPAQPASVPSSPNQKED